MKATITKTEIEAEIGARFGSAFRQQEKRPGEFLPSGIPEIDSFIGGLARGAITEIYGPASSGRTSFMLSAMARATRHEEVCALIDTNNTFDPQSARQAEIEFERLLWMRCANNLEHAFKATDLLLQAGGFGLVILDLGDVPAKSAKRIISSWWYRFRRTLEATPTALIVIVEDSAVRSCASVTLELKTENYLWSSASDSSPIRENLSSPHNLSLSARVVSMNTPSVTNIRRQPLLFEAGTRPFLTSKSLSSVMPHTTLLHGLAFKVECRRPLYLKKEVSCKAHG